MDNTNTLTPQPVITPEPSGQEPTIVNTNSPPVVQPQSTFTSPVAAQMPQPPKWSGLKKLFIVIVSVVGLVILIGGIGLFALIVYFFHSADSICGPKSSTHKTEVSKVAVFNTVSVIPGQPNEPASIYDSSEGICNIDVAQSYSATKSYTVNMNGTTALSTITDNLNKQGFTLSKQVFSDDNCSNIWGEANYTGKSITITVDFGSPTKQCPNPDPISLHPNITQAQFASTTVTSIKATVSTPDQTI